MEAGLQIIKPLQEGGQARVYLCTYDETPIVLKVFKSASGAALERELSAGLRLKATSEGRGHNRIVSLRCSQPLSVAENGAEMPALAFEVGHCDLLEYLETSLGSGRGLGDCSATRTWFKDILSAIVFCHASGVAHLDIKPENIILCPGNADTDGSSASVAKLGDFGTAVIQDSADFGSQNCFCKKVVGSPHYAAPEVVELRKLQERQRQNSQKVAQKKRTKSPWSFLRRNSAAAVAPMASGDSSQTNSPSHKSSSRDSALHVNPTWGWSSASQSTSTGFLTSPTSMSSPVAGAGSNLSSQASIADATESHQALSPHSCAGSSGVSSVSYYSAFPADVWSFGVALYVGATGRWPFGTADAGKDSAFKAFLEATEQCPRSAAADHRSLMQATPAAKSPHWTWPSCMGSNLREVVQHCLQRDPAARPTAAQLLDHPWFGQ